MENLDDRVHPNIGGMLVGVVGFIAVALYLTMAISAQDPLWFMTGFTDQPTRMILYHGGTRQEILPGQPGFAELAEAVRATLAQGVTRPSAIGLSEGSLQDAYTLFVSLQVFFDHPVKLHANFNTGSPTQMLFLITGRHSELNLVVLGTQETLLSDAPALKTLSPLRETLYRVYPNLER